MVFRRGPADTDPQMRFRPGSAGFTLLLGALTALPPLAIDMGLPALSLIQASLGASAGEATLTLSIFLAGYGSAQLVVGPLSDRFGRRPVMLAGLSLFTLAGIGCALAPSILLLLAFRLAAGIGAAGSTTLAFAIVRDVFSGQAARVQISTVTTVTSVGPMIAPTIGGLMLLLGGWRFIYSTLAVAGGILVTLVWLGLAETRPAARGAALGMVRRYAIVLREPRIVGFVLVNALCFAGLFAFIAVSSVVLIDGMGASVALFGLLFALTSGGILAGNSFNTMLARRNVRQERPLAIGLWLAPVGAAVASGLLLGGIVGLATFVPFIVLNGFCRGMIGPNATHAALEPLPAHAGAASALLGCTQMLVGALAGALVAALLPPLGPLAVTLPMFGFNALALILWRLVEWRYPSRT